MVSRELPFALLLLLLKYLLKQGRTWLVFYQPCLSIKGVAILADLKGLTEGLVSLLVALDVKLLEA